MRVLVACETSGIARRAIAKPHGWRRTSELFFARIFARLVETGKRWRNEDMTND